MGRAGRRERLRGELARLAGGQADGLDGQQADRPSARLAKSSRLRCVGGLSLATGLTSLFARHDDCAAYLKREHTIKCRRCIARARSSLSSDRSRNETARQGIRAALVAIEAIFPAPQWRERSSCLLLGRMQTCHRSKQQGQVPRFRRGSGLFVGGFAHTRRWSSERPGRQAIGRRLGFLGG